MSLEGLKQIFEIGGVILLFLTFIFGAGALYTASRLNVEKDAQLRQFDKDLTDNKGKVAGLEHDAAVAKAEMAAQQTRAANAERSLLELQERVKHRHLTQEQRGELIRRLRLAPKGVALLSCPVDDNEACDFLGEIGEALSKAGWTVDRDIPRIFHVVPPSLELSIRNKMEANQPAEALDSALEAIGIKIASRAVDSTLAQPLNVRILVGRKPEAN